MEWLDSHLFFIYFFFLRLQEQSGKTKPMILAVANPVNLSYLICGIMELPITSNSKNTFQVAFQQASLKTNTKITKQFLNGACIEIVREDLAKFLDFLQHPNFNWLNLKLCMCQTIFQVEYNLSCTILRGAEICFFFFHLWIRIWEIVKLAYETVAHIISDWISQIIQF